MNEKDCPGASVELKRPPFEESEVTVCGTASLFVHVTFVPVLTTSVEGLNEKFCILTVAVEGETDVVVVVVEEVVTVEVSGVVDTADGVCSGTVLELLLAKR